jgi:hypothetical protein
MALEHIISVLKTSNLLPMVTLDLLEADSGNLTASGRISGLSGLTVWLEEYVSVRFLKFVILPA